VLHIAGLDIETHCLTLRACLGIFSRWSARHPDHDPVVLLINSSGQDAMAPLFPHEAKFHQEDIDAVDRDVAEVLGPSRLITPETVRGGHATLRDAVQARSWPTVGACRGRFLVVLDAPRPMKPFSPMAMLRFEAA
jgi:hypothetical protein